MEDVLKSTKRKLRRFHITLAVGFLFALIGAGLLTAGFVIQIKTYQELVLTAPTASDEDRSQAYERAVRLIPGRADAYIKLLDLYNEDGVFSQAENEQFLALYNSNQKKLSRRQDGFPVLHYKAAFLYLNGYEGATSTRLRLAIPFLNRAMNTISELDPNYRTVDCYSKIGSYYETFLWDSAASTREVPPQQMQELLSDIEETVIYLNAENESIYIQLGFDEAVCNLLCDQRDILAVTVPQEDVTDLLDLIYSSLPEESAIQREQTKSVLRGLKSNENNYRELISRAFERSLTVGN